MITQVHPREVKTMPNNFLAMRRQVAAWRQRGISSLLPPTVVLILLILIWGVVHVPLAMLGQGDSFRAVLDWGLREGMASVTTAITGLTGVDPGNLPSILRSALPDADAMTIAGTSTAPATAVAQPANEPGESSVNAPSSSQQQPVAQPDNQGGDGVLAGKIVVLDPGHGGNDTGTIGPDGIEEKWVTLPIALKAAQMLRQEGAEVIMTRTGDTNPGLYDRTAIANQDGADVFVSIHGNSYKENPDIGGTGTYIYSPTPKITPGQQLGVRLKLANCLQNSLVASLKLHNS